MDRKLKMLPVVFMLVAGAVTGIITYTLHYDGKNALFILLAVLLLFYCIGFYFRKMIWQFEDELARKEKERLEEGTVLEKSTESQTEKDAESNVKDAGEQ